MAARETLIGTLRKFRAFMFPRGVALDPERAAEFCDLLAYLDDSRSNVWPFAVEARFGIVMVNRAKRLGLICEGVSSIGDEQVFLTPDGRATLLALRA